MKQRIFSGLTGAATISTLTVSALVQEKTKAEGHSESAAERSLQSRSLYTRPSSRLECGIG